MVLYSADRPNSKLRSFVESHLDRPTSQTERPRRSVQEFDTAIETTKNSAVYSMHSYHLGKKPLDAVGAYVTHYTRKGDLVLDPFCGSGSTLLAALIHGRKAVGIDASPAATFISRFYLEKSDPEDLAAKFQSLRETVAQEMNHLYGTVCHVCGSESVIHYVVYSNLYQCSRCDRTVSLFEASQFETPCCPYCLAESGTVQSISSRRPVCGNAPVAVNFSCGGSCSPRRMTRSILDKDPSPFFNLDLKRIKELETEPVPYPYPRHFMMNVSDSTSPWGDEWRPSRDFRRVSELFTYRNLRALAAMMHAAGEDRDLRAVITSGMLAASRKAQHLDGGGGYIPGNWALPPMSKQRNAIESVTNIFRRILKAKTTLKELLQSQEACLSTQSATSMAEIPSSSVDYIFTDPPYGGAVQYAELNFVWEAWLGLDTNWHAGEIIVNRTRNKTAADWTEMMQKAMAECYRVLRPGRRLSMCFHDSSADSWRRLQQIMAGAGFEVGNSDRTVTIDTGSNTYNQRVTNKVTKRDLVINFRKPGRGEAKPRRKENEKPQLTSFNQAARSIVEMYLVDNPGAKTDRIYDHFMNALMRRGPIEEHSFPQLLAEVARNGDGDRTRWYLKRPKVDSSVNT
jgi:SAM-dependent methyltransferase